MSTSIIIVLSILLLLAYFFELSARFTKIPSVILLLLTGWLARQLVFYFNLGIPDLDNLLPTLGTIGLILIVLEGSLELEMNRSKIPVITKSFLSGLVSILLLAAIFASILRFGFDVPLKLALLNVIPLCIISSAIAIPSVRNLSEFNKEFIIYESSISDICGVLFFNFISINAVIDISSFTHFGLEIFIIIAISFVSVLVLSFLLSRIEHHITYTPIIISVILIYFLSKMFHLPGLIFILVFGLVLGNLENLKTFKFMERFRPDKLDLEVKKFKEITAEATFLIRAMFFLLFGFLMKAEEITNLTTLPWAILIIFIIYITRRIILSISKLPFNPLLFISPRGLITILLFLSIAPESRIPFINNSIIIQTIILSILMMMSGLILKNKD